MKKITITIDDDTLASIDTLKKSYLSSNTSGIIRESIKRMVSGSNNIAKSSAPEVVYKKDNSALPKSVYKDGVKQPWVRVINGYSITASLRDSVLCIEDKAIATATALRMVGVKDGSTFPPGENARWDSVILSKFRMSDEEYESIEKEKANKK